MIAIVSFFLFFFFCHHRQLILISNDFGVVFGLFLNGIITGLSKAVIHFSIHRLWHWILSNKIHVTTYYSALCR